MKTILKYIADHWIFLFEDFGFSIVRTRYDRAFGGNCAVILEGRYIRLMLDRDRGVYELDFQEKNSLTPNRWYPIKYGYELCQKKYVNSYRINPGVSRRNAKFLRENVERLEDLFSDAKRDSTMESLAQMGALDGPSVMVLKKSSRK